MKYYYFVYFDNIHDCLLKKSSQIKITFTLQAIFQAELIYLCPNTKQNFK